MRSSPSSSRPDQLDSRADSPMRDDIRLNSEVPVNGTTPHGLPTPANDVPSSGFTAVNGESQRSRPDEQMHRSISMSNGERRPHSRADPEEPGQKYATHGNPGVTKIGALLQDAPIHPSGPYQAPGWRPHATPYSQVEGERPQPGNSASSKRKRDESTMDEARDGARDGPQYRERVASPKRHTTTLNSTVSITSPGRVSQSRTFSPEHDELEPATTGTYVRVPTPPMRRNHGEPPALPRPEVESSLAASLQRSLLAEQQDKQAQAAAQRNSPPDEDDEDEDDSTNHQQSQFYDPDGGQQGDSGDSKKRKRNFSNRTKTGCHTCRARKKKCDEGKPTCLNCQRGSFACGGYGAKPPGGPKVTAVRQVVPLQSKQHFEQPNGPLPPGPNHYFPESRYGHNGDPRQPPQYDPQRPVQYESQHPYRYPGPVDPRPASRRDSWGPARPQWPPLEPGSQLADRLPHVDFSGVPPPPLIHPYPPQPQPHIDSWRNPPPPPGHYRQPTGPPTIISSGDSVATTNTSQRVAQMLSFLPTGQKTERSKMITGEPYKHFLDDELIRDRQSCRRAVESYNNACAASSTCSPAERERYFQTIMDPTARTFNDGIATKWTGPTGTCGSRTMVDTPFSCEFGYNIHLGEGAVIAANCLMQDACRIFIGDHTVIGPNVKFYCVTTSIDATLRQGSQGNFVAGAIKVEDDVFIGADVIVLPYRTIGKGAVVGAGAVVTRDVKPYTVVAGNPAKVVRKRKIESGPDVDRHDDAIEEQNKSMMDDMQRGYPSAAKNRMR